mmetsp:Transcript_62276/g.120005  ORF Transcript_62276/g.120005 Transcript_62276/m.120005 type:complete len:82 (+) Transcript_62276:250-495(+)
MTHHGRRRRVLLPLPPLLAYDDLVMHDGVDTEVEFKSLPSEHSEIGFGSCDGRLAGGRGGAETGEYDEEAKAVLSTGAVCA